MSGLERAGKGKIRRTPTLRRASRQDKNSLAAHPDDRLYKAEFKSRQRGPGHRGAFSPLTRRILYVNALALCLLAVGLLFLDEYRDSLIAAETEALRVQGELFGAALGEGAVTRCNIRLDSGETGSSYSLGRNKQKALQSAVIDALWQRDDMKSRIEAEIIAPLAGAQASEKDTVREETEATKVNFFTMVRGDN